MKEGWIGDDYLILFDESEIATTDKLYAVSEMLPGYHALGLRGWDDFIVRDSQGTIYSLPTIPLDPRYLVSYIVPELPKNFSPDPRFIGRIKWYVKPIVFGGDPTQKENTTWVSLEEHARLVRWWNDLYRSTRNKGQATLEAET
jgi:hypothetical protein